MRNNQTMSSRDRGSVEVVIAIVLGVLLLLCGAVYGTYLWQQSKIDDLSGQVERLQTQLAVAQQDQSTPATGSTYTSQKGVKINVYTPVASSLLTSPVIVLGEVPGNWSFEANLPVKLLDSDGKTVASGSAHLVGDWMTSNLVPFSVSLSFTSVKHGDGRLVIEKDNPSGLEANNDSVSIPVKF